MDGRSFHAPVLTKDNLERELKSLYRHLHPEAKCPEHFSSEMLAKMEAHLDLHPGSTPRGSSLERMIAGGQAIPPKMQEDFARLHGGIFSKPAGAGIQENEKALSGYALSSAATGSRLEDMPAARDGLETMEHVRDRFTGGQTNIYPNLDRVNVKAGAVLLAQRELAKDLKFTAYKSVKGMALDEKEQALLSCWPENRRAMFARFTDDEMLNSYLRNVSVNAASNLGKVGNCFELSNHFVTQHSSKLQPGQALSATESHRVDHVWPELTAADGDWRHDNLLFDIWSQAKSFMTPIQRQHGSYPAGSDTQNFFIDKSFGSNAANDSRLLLDNLRKNDHAMALYESYVERFTPGPTRRAEEVVRHFKHMESAGKPVKSFEGIYREPPHVLSDDFRQEASQAISKAGEKPLHRDILTSRIDRDFGASVRQSAKDAPGQFESLKASAMKLLSPQDIPEPKWVPRNISRQGRRRPAFTEPYSKIPEGSLFTPKGKPSGRPPEQLLGKDGLILAEKQKNGRFLNPKGDEYIPILEGGVLHGKNELLEIAPGGKRLVRSSSEKTPVLKVLSTNGRVEETHGLNPGAVEALAKNGFTTTDFANGKSNQGWLQKIFGGIRK